MRYHETMTTTKYDHYTDDQLPIRSYGSWRPMLEDADIHGEYMSERFEHLEDWFGGTRSDMLRELEDGSSNSDGVRMFEGYRDRAQSIKIPSPSPVVSLAPAGSVPCVPAFLAGSPHAMRRRRMENVGGMGDPLRVYISLTSSADIEADTVASHILAALAFSDRVGMSRPVEVWGMVGALVKGTNVHSAVFLRLGTFPLDARRAASYSNITMIRGVMYEIGRSVCRNMKPGEEGHKQYTYPIARLVARQCRRHAGPGVACLVLPWLHAENARREPLERIQNEAREQGVLS